MSPQQALGKPATARDDIYSFGATIYELLTSRPPFFSGNIQHQLESVVPPSMTDRRAELEISGAPIPSQWEEAIAASLAKDPDARPASVREFGEVLLDPRKAVAAARARDRASQSASKGSFVSRSSPPLPWAGVSRQFRIAAICLFLLLLTAAGVATYYVGVVVPREQERERHEQAQRIADAKAEAARVRQLQVEEAKKFAAAEAAKREAEEAARLAEQRRIEAATAAARNFAAADPAGSSAVPGKPGFNPPDEEEEVAPATDSDPNPKPKAGATKSSKKKSSSRNRPKSSPSFGQKVKRFFGF
jgi:hypothetical protein